MIMPQPLAVASKSGCQICAWLDALIRES
jgi:hypothetical protein